MNGRDVPVLEAYVESAAQAEAALAAGATRLELCGPGEGGLTPSEELVQEVISFSPVPVHVMVRARAGDFVYNVEHLFQMGQAVDRARNAGAAGIVTGVLQSDYTINRDWMAYLVARARPMQVVIHRAFDATPDADRALDTLLALGVDGVLTAGHAPSALEGASAIARHVRRAGSSLEVIAGGGVRAANARLLVDATGVRAVHARATDAAVFAALVTALR